jgi:hypothetical protein
MHETMDPHQNLANRLYEVVSGHLILLENWGVYLTHSDYAAEFELRNKIGCIWLSALIDTAEADCRVIPEVIGKAKALGFENMVHNANELKKICAITAEFLSTFSKAEQIFLTNIRNQITHTYFGNRHNDQVQVKYVANGQYFRERMPWGEYTAIVESLSGTGTTDDALTPIITRAVDLQQRYWIYMDSLRHQREFLYRMLCGGGTIHVRDLG